TLAPPCPPVVPPFWDAKPVATPAGGFDVVVVVVVVDVVVLVDVDVDVEVEVDVEVGTPLTGVNVHCLVATLSQELICTPAPTAVELSLMFMHLVLLVSTRR
ncbi:hypothetical protein B0I31_1383, partial [Saccharothrix carnea]